MESLRELPDPTPCLTEFVKLIQTSDKEEDSELILVLTRKVGKLTVRNKELQAELNELTLKYENAIKQPPECQSQLKVPIITITSDVHQQSQDHLIAEEVPCFIENHHEPSMYINMEGIRPTTNGCEDKSDTTAAAEIPDFAPLIITQIESTIEKQDFNTDNLVEQIKDLLNRIGLTVKDFSKEQNLSKAYLGNLIRNPEPWQTLSEAKKSHYRKMYKWYVENQHSVEENRILKPNMVSKKFQMKPAEVCGSLNTAEVARQLSEMLVTHNISPGHFAQRKLFITKGYYEQLVENPQPWETLSDVDRDIYRRFYKWTLAEPVEIIALKRHMHAYKARLQRNHNIRNFRTKSKTRRKKNSQA
jgi:hypothetical protein